MTDQGALDEAVESIAARHSQQHVGLVMGAVTPAGPRSIVPVGRLRAPDGPAPRADSLFEIGSVTKVFTPLLLAEAVTRGELSLDTTVADLLPEVHVPTRDGVAMSSTWQPTPEGCPTRCRSQSSSGPSGRPGTVTCGRRSTVRRC